MVREPISELFLIIRGTIKGVYYTNSEIVFEWINYLENFWKMQWHGRYMAAHTKMSFEMELFKLIYYCFCWNAVLFYYLYT